MRIYVNLRMQIRVHLRREDSSETRSAIPSMIKGSRQIKRLESTIFIQFLFPLIFIKTIFFKISKCSHDLTIVFFFRKQEEITMRWCSHKRPVRSDRSSLRHSTQTTNQGASR